VILTLVLQTVATVLALPVGGVALAVARRLGGATRSAQAWSLTGWTFLLLGFLGVLSSVFSIWAVAEGSGTPVWNRYLDWAPAGNYARQFLVLAFAGMLVVLALPRPMPFRLRSALRVALGVAIAGGAVVGGLEGPLGSTNHMSRLAVLTTVAVVLLFSALLLAATTDAIDRLLWLALTTYALKQALSVSLLSILAWSAFSRGIQPNALYAMHIAAFCVMLLMVLRRYHHARRRQEVPALFERVDSPRRHRMVN
jgi:low affinity Fe/Cu permease